MTTQVTLHDGRVLTAHDAALCYRPDACPIHNPSQHPLREAPMDWHQEIHHLVRICEHGLSHPDPDDLGIKAALLEIILVESICSVHIDRCDGCCHV